MLDFTSLRNKEKTFDEFVADITQDDLRHFTNEMVDTMLEMIKDCTDEDVVFVPVDPEADDPYAEDKKEVDLAWTLGHVIAHSTASSEESAALAAEMARGVEYHGRSRSEVPWQTVTTIGQCRHRLEESRRICLASFDMWPDQPYLDNFHQISENWPNINAIGRYVFGLAHADSHLNQIKEVIRQSKEMITSG